MKPNVKSGSILILALLTVLVSTSLAVALSLWTTAQQRGLRQISQRRQARLLIHNTLAATLGTDPPPPRQGTVPNERGTVPSEPSTTAPRTVPNERGTVPSGTRTAITSPTGGTKPGSEVDLTAWVTRLDEWVLVFEGKDSGSVPNRNWGSVPNVGGSVPNGRRLVDEGGKVHVTKAPAELLVALLRKTTGMDKERAESYRNRIIDWFDDDLESSDKPGFTETESYSAGEEGWNAPNRPIAAVEEIQLIPGIEPEHYLEFAPHLTIYSDGKINLNSATPEVLAAAFSLAGPAGEAAQRLLARIMEYRHAGQIFESPDKVAAQLGQLPADEVLLLSYMQPFLNFQPLVISGVATAYHDDGQEAIRVLRVSFSWNRGTGRFERWLEL